MLDYQDFLKYVENGITEYLPESYQDAQISIGTINKNNGKKLDGLTIIRPGENISPTIYLNDFYNELMNGGSSKDIMEKIADIRVKNEVVGFNINDFNEFSKIKDRVAFKLINKESNEEFLRNVPHKVFGNLAAIYKIHIQNFMDGNSTATINNGMIERWNITENELYKAAMESSPLVNPYTLRPMSSVIQGMMTKESTAPEMQEEKLEEMNVLTNQSKIDGAAVILHPGVLENIADRIHGNYYVVPSSVHECLVMPKDVIDLEYLNDMIHEVNRDAVSQEEVLSETAYEYDAKDRALYIAKSHELVLRSADLENNKSVHKGKLLDKMVEKYQDRETTKNSPEIEM